MDTIMTKIAYKLNTTNPNLPSDFIIDHFETDQDQIEGYLVAEKDVFQQLLLNNVTSLRKHEAIQTPSFGPSAAPLPMRPAHEAEPVDQELMNKKKKALEDELQKRQSEAEMFQQFLAWKKSQENNG